MAFRTKHFSIMSETNDNDVYDYSDKITNEYLKQSSDQKCGGENQFWLENAVTEKKK